MSSINSVLVRSLSNWLLTQVVGFCRQEDGLWAFCHLCCLSKEKWFVEVHFALVA